MKRILTIVAIVLLPCLAIGAEPRPMPKPQDAATTDAAYALGRMLAFDTRMSSTRTHSCMTCHLPERGYSDGLRVSRGATDNTERNAPTLINSGYKIKQFLDGRADLLEGQADQPLQSLVEMGQQDSDLPFRRIAQIPEYQAKFREAFGRGVNKADGLKAIAAFERTLVSTDAPIDRAVTWRQGANGQWFYNIQPAAKWVFEDAQYRGLHLFFGKAGCVSCHQSDDYRLDGDYRNIGLAAASTRDDGRETISGRSSGRRAFAVPTLREVAKTGPWGHAGQFDTLAQVVAFKNNPPADPFRSPAAVPLGLTAGEQADLVAFLEVAFTGKFPTVTAPALPQDPPGYQHFQEQQNNGRRAFLPFRRR